MKATPTGSWVRIETGITPSQVAEAFGRFTSAIASGNSAAAEQASRDLYEALNPRLTVGQARAFGFETVNAATTAAREAMNEEGVAS